MFLAMNRFKITPGFEAGFEKFGEKEIHTSLLCLALKSFLYLKAPRLTNMSCMRPILSGKAKRLS